MIISPDSTYQSAHIPSVLCIAGFDPASGAGILIDTAVCRAMKVHSVAALTSVAAQGLSGIKEIVPLSPSFISEQLQILFEEFQPATVKIGMLYSEDAVKIVSEQFATRKIPVIYDPVMSASSGGSLLDKSALPAIEKKLIPHCMLITPNLQEAETFLNRRIRSPEQTERAAIELSHRWNCAVLVKGGHLPEYPVDFFAFEGRCERFLHHRVIAKIRIRGTGCALSTAIAAEIALGSPLIQAVGKAISFIQKAIESAYTSAVDREFAFLNFTPPDL